MWEGARFPQSAGMSEKETSPEAILQLGLAFWGSKTLLSAVELGVFTALAREPMTGKALMAELDLHPRGTDDFLDTLVSLGMLERTDGEYSNTAATDLFLDREKPSYIGGILEMANARLYPFWGALTEGLRTGEPQNEAKAGENFFEVLYADQSALRKFLRAMTGITMGAALAVAERFPWERYQSFVDLGTAEGCLPVQLALRHPHLNGGGFDLPPVQAGFEEFVDGFGLSERVRFHAGDFFTDPLPAADVFILGRVLHDWGLDEKLTLLRRAYDALPEGGALVVYDAIIDDERRSNTFGLLMSLNMLIETAGGFDYTAADCRSWMGDVGFRETYVEPLVGPDSMVVGLK